MNPGELTPLLDRLLAASGEHEWVEFKHNNDDPHAIDRSAELVAAATVADLDPAALAERRLLQAGLDRLAAEAGA